MIKILMSGCNGKMGQVITNITEQEKDFKITAGYDIQDIVDNPYPVFTNLSNCNEDLDVIIDFSHPAALKSIINFATEKKIPVVMATTGLSSNDIKLLKDASKQIPVFFTANMSLGVNLLYYLVKKAASVLESSFDIEIIERHHNQKIDAPSGTALAIADEINSVLDEKLQYVFDRHSRRKKRNKNEIGLHAVRGGSIVGEHSVVFAGMDEIIEINHTALSKDIFASGALKAAKFICDKTPGFYSMSDLIEI